MDGWNVLAKDFRALYPVTRVMKRYLAQLLADLETAVRHAPEPSSYAFRSPFSEEEDDNRSDALHLRYVRLCDVFGLAPNACPPVDRLPKFQVADRLHGFPLR